MSDYGLWLNSSHSGLIYFRNCLAANLAYSGYHHAWISLFYILFSFQAGEFFESAQRNASFQQREIEASSIGEGSIESPLLLEQV